MTCAMPSSSARRPRPSRIPAGTVSPATAPHRSPSISPEYEPARDRAGSGAYPPSSLTTGPSSKSAASTLSTSLSISPATSVVTLYSPTISSTRRCWSLNMRWRAATTAAGTAPSPAI
eukprot:1625834-Pleurochrysis_carterae.AAC.1